MAPREDLVSSAVTFLQDPSVSASPIQKRIEFLQSKNLTQEEIDLALARSSDESYQPIQNAPSQNHSYPSPQQYNRAPRYAPYGNQYTPYGEWQPPPELARRDWRDWFIMATVTSTAAYGLYVITKRYIAPLISPPTPPQLESDKAAIDEQFTRAFALLDTLSNDTATLKSAEEARTERLDKALEEVEAVVTELKAATRRREDETRRLNDEIRGLKDGIPKALEGHREGSEKRLRELGSELKSLKALMGNRFGGGGGGGGGQQGPPQSNGAASTPSTQPSENSQATNGTPIPYGASSAPAYQFPSSSSSTTASNANASTPNLPTPTNQRPSGPSSPFPSSTNLSGGGVGTGSGSGKASIPAWQMAAASRRTGTPSSGTNAGSGSGSGEGVEGSAS